MLTNIEFTSALVVSSLHACEDSLDTRNALFV
jgi:hypothetical protein